MKWYIGVDPGQKGGLALIHGNQAVEYERMPGIGGIDDFFYTAGVSSGHKLVCIFEEHKGGGPETNADTHRSAGYYEGVVKALCHVHKVPFHPVTPQAWKGKLGLTFAPGEAKGLTYTQRRNIAKKKSIAMAEGLFPSVNLLFPRCKVKADGPAEALLLAEWGRRLGL